MIPGKYIHKTDQALDPPHFYWDRQVYPVMQRIALTITLWGEEYDEEYMRICKGFASLLGTSLLDFKPNCFTLEMGGYRFEKCVMTEWGTDFIEPIGKLPTVRRNPIIQYRYTVMAERSLWLNRD